MSLLREESPATALKTLCGLFGYSRQSYYNREGDKEFAENAIEPLIVEKAKDYRQDNPGLGCAKLYLIIRRLFESAGCMPSWDAFIELFRKHGLMVQIKRCRHYKTTDSNHHYRKYDNLIKEIVPKRPNEIFLLPADYYSAEPVSSSASNGKVSKNPRHALRCQGIVLNLLSEDDASTQAIMCFHCKAN